MLCASVPPVVPAAEGVAGAGLLAFAGLLTALVIILARAVEPVITALRQITAAQRDIREERTRASLSEMQGEIDRLRDITTDQRDELSRLWQALHDQTGALLEHARWDQAVVSQLYRLGGTPPPMVPLTPAWQHTAPPPAPPPATISEEHHIDGTGQD